MADWITKIFEQLVMVGLDDSFEIADIDIVMQCINVYDQIQLTREQLNDTNVVECMKELLDDTPSKYLKSRLGAVLRKWRQILRNDKSKSKKQQRAKCSSVFEAIITDDDQFFETTSVPELLHRLLKSFDKNYKVIDMSTALNTISMFEKMDIPPSQLAQTHLVSYLGRVRRQSTNKYLTQRLRMLLRKWRDSLVTR